MEVGFYEHHHWKLLSVLFELMSDQFDKFSHHLFMLMCAKCILWFECKDWDGLSDVLWLYCTVCDNCKWLIHRLNKDFFQCHSLPIFRPPSATVVSAEPFSHGPGTLRCLQKEMATYRHWSVSLWRDPDDVSHRRILSPDKIEWRLISATLCGWGRCFMADQLWLMTRIREEEASHGTVGEQVHRVVDR